MAIVKQLFKHFTAKGSYTGESKYTPSMGTLYDFSFKDIDGNTVDFKEYTGKVALCVNVACKWGATKRTYEWLAPLYKKYRDQGFVVLAFPCNQFGGQEPWPEPEIKKFVQQFNVEFPMFSKSDVNGDKTNPVYKFLKGVFPGDITWNFASKFVVNHQGIPVARFDKSDTFEQIEQAIQQALAARNGEKGDDNKQATSS